MTDIQRLVWHRRVRLTAMMAGADVAMVIFTTSAMFSARHPAKTEHPVPQHYGPPIAPGSHIGPRARDSVIRVGR